MMTPGSRHTAAKSTQRLLLARRVNFLVMQMHLQMDQKQHVFEDIRAHFKYKESVVHHFDTSQIWFTHKYTYLTYKKTRCPQ